MPRHHICTDNLHGACRALLRDTGGGIAVITAIALPAVLMLAVGGIDLAFVARDKSVSQDVADAAALMGAQELSLAGVGIEARTQAYALNQLKEMAARSKVTVTVKTLDEHRIKVAVDTHRMSFFGNILPPGGFYTHAEAVGATMRQAALCVLTLEGGGSDVLDLANTSKMTTSCLVHSDSDIKVAQGAALTGKVVEAVGTSSGVTTPTALTGVKQIGDPFTKIDVAFPAPCLLGGLLPLTFLFDSSLPSGVHCFNYTVAEDRTLTLSPGIHYFGGDLELKKDASLMGAGVTLVFGPNSKFKTKDGAAVELTGATSGKLAGFVLATTRDYEGDFKLNSDPISKITGAIYVPSGALRIEGTVKAAASSDWTVIAAKQLKLEGAPNLVINANYGGSGVPVPQGVGPSGGARLSD